MPSYIAPAILPVGGQLVFGGRAKVGKTFMMMEFARALALGETPFDCPLFTVPKPVRVLMIEQELGEIGLQRRAAKLFDGTMGRKADNLWYVSKVPELKLDTGGGVKLLRNLIEDVEPEVLILDPIGRMHSWDENNAQEMARMFGVLDQIQKATPGMALIFSHHFGKPKDPRGGSDPLDPYEFRGSSKFFDNPDSLVTLQRVRELPKDWEAWSLKARFTLRHGESPDDIILHVNEHDDNRVRFDRSTSEPRPKALPQTSKEKLEQRAFAAADIAANPPQRRLFSPAN